jgi:hypothetical protein
MTGTSERLNLAAKAERWGRWNWYLPRWLKWLPAVRIEGAPPAGPMPALGEPVRATRRARTKGRRVVLVTGPEPIDRVPAISGLDKALETTADPATLDH